MAKPSSASLSVVPVVAMTRMAPPRGLSDDESRLWREVVDSKPVEWFQPDSAPLLTEYVRAVVMSGQLDAQLKAALVGSETGELKALLDMRDKESKRVVSIATKLRLTQQSRYTPQAAATANKKAAGGRPWER